MVGVLLGPLLGFASVLLGEVAYLAISPFGAHFGFLTPFTPALASLQAGLVARRKTAWAALLLSAFIACWLAVYGAHELPYLAPHAAGLALVLLLGTRRSFLRDEKGPRLFAKCWAVVYSANVTRHIFGTMLFLWFYGMYELTWLLPITSAEQALFAALGAMVLAPTLLHFRKKETLEG